MMRRELSRCSRRSSPRRSKQGCRYQTNCRWCPTCACSPGTAAGLEPEATSGARQLLRADLDGPSALAPPDAGRRPLGGRLPLLAAVQRLAVPRHSAPARQQLGVGARVLRLRQRQGAAPPHARRLRRRRRALVLQPGAHPRAAARPPRGHRQRHGREPRHRHPLLQLLGGAALHRLRRSRHPAGRDLLVPHRRADGQRDRPGAALRPLRLGSPPSTSSPASSSPWSPAGSSGA